MSLWQRIRSALRTGMHAEWMRSILEQWGLWPILASAGSGLLAMLWDVLSGGGGPVVTGLVTAVAIYVFLIAARLQSWMSSGQGARFLEPLHDGSQSLPLSMSDDARLCADSIEQFYKAYLEPASGIVQSHWGDAVYDSAVSREWKESKQFLKGVHYYLSMHDYMSRSRIDRYFDGRNNNIDLIRECIVDMLDNYFARYSGLKELAGAIKSLEFPSDLQEMHKAVCMNLHALVTVPSTRPLYNCIQGRQPPWLDQLRP